MELLSEKQKVYVESLKKSLGEKTYNNVCKENNIEQNINKQTKDEARILIKLLVDIKENNQVFSTNEKKISNDINVDEVVDSFKEQLKQKVIVLTNESLKIFNIEEYEYELLSETKYCKYYIVKDLAHYDLIYLGFKYDNETKFYHYLFA